jgi:hypothetical protein
MSLNRFEQALHDYIKCHPEERQYIHEKVRMIVTGYDEAPKAVARIDSELWRYYEERSAVVPAFREAARAYGLRRTSMKNLAEYLIRLWSEPKARKAGFQGDKGSPKDS